MPNQKKNGTSFNPTSVKKEEILKNGLKMGNIYKDHNIIQNNKKSKYQLKPQKN